MDLVSELEKYAALCTPRLTVVFANIFEANTLIDDIPQDQYPVLVVFPIVIEDTLKTSGAWGSLASVTGFTLLKKQEEQTTDDLTVKELEASAVIPMRKLTRQLVGKLNTSDLVDKETRGVTTVNYTPAYGEMDQHLHGTAWNFDIPLNEGSTCQV